MATTTDTKTPSHASNVYLFKNGYGMIVKTFDFPPTKGNNGAPVELLDPPSNPVHGTFWIQSLSNNTSISSIRTKKTRKFVDEECCTVQDLLEANVGQDVQLLLMNSMLKTNEWISGKIISVKRAQQPSENADTDDTLTIAPGDPTYSLPAATQTGNLVLFETTDNGLTALSLSDIQSIRGATLNKTYQRKTFKNCLSIDYKNESESNDTGLLKYLTFGITWAPSYNLVLLSSKDASVKQLRLSSKAVILNDIENMNVDNLFCIVGFPNVSKFASVVDPIISGADVRTFLDELNQSESGAGRRYPQNTGIMSNSFMKQQMVPSNSVMMQQMIEPLLLSNNDGPDDSQPQQDTNTDDLHLYEFKNVLLQKKERLMLPIFDIEIPYKDVYHCKINALQFGSIFSGYNDTKQFEDVWHSVEFENISNFVWTTAPIVITKGEHEQQFIGQDALTYTLKGSAAFVNLTKALDVRVKLDEKIINTIEKKADNIEGKIEVMNYKSEEVVVVINISIMGKTSDYSVKPKKDAVKAGYIRANPQHDIQWEVNIKPKQALEIRYNRLFNRKG